MFSFKNKSNMADACDSVPVRGLDIPPPTFSQFPCKQPMNPHIRVQFGSGNKTDKPLNHNSTLHAYC